MNSRLRDLQKNPLTAVLFTFVIVTLACFPTFATGRGAIYWNPGTVSWWSRLFVVTIAGVIFGISYWSATAAPDRDDRPNSWSFAALMLGTFLLSLVVSNFVIEGFLHSSDEYTYLFQAETFLQGRLWNTPPPLGSAMASIYTWIVGDRWAGQYPPGWPSLIAANLALGLPQIVLAPLLALITGFLLNALMRDKAEAGIRTAVVLFAAVSPFVLFNSASLYSHVAASMMVVCGALACDRSLRTGALCWALLLGMAIGALATIRYIAALIIVLPVGVALLLSRYRLRLCAGAIVGGLPFLLLILWYHWAITGDPLKPVYHAAGRTVDRLYFDGPSIVRGLQQTGIRFWELSLWTSPAFTFLWVVAMVVKARTRRLDIIDALFPVAALILIFYPIFGGGYGPRYYYDFWLLACYTVATGISDLAPGVYRRAARMVVILSATYALTVLPWLSRDLSEVTRSKRDLYDQAAEKRLANAIVCVRSSTSHLHPLRPYDLTRNGIGADGPILYADCTKTDLTSIRKAYPSREVWEYSREEGQPKGLLALAPDS